MRRRKRATGGIPLGYRRCENPGCIHKIVQEEDIHESGYCSACCPIYGPLDCTRCWEDDDDDDFRE